MFNDSNESTVQTINPAHVAELTQTLKLIPYEVRMRFKIIDGLLYMSLTTTSWNNMVQTMELPANEKLIEAVLPAISGRPNFELLERFADAEDKQEALKDEQGNLMSELLEQFLGSGMKAFRDKDFVSASGKEYLVINFYISYHRCVKFCILKTDELMSMYFKAISPETKRDGNVPFSENEGNVA